MTRISRALLGEFSGTAGNLVFVQRNGKNYFRSRPKPRNPDIPKSEKTVRNEKAFGLTSSFVKEISKSDLLKHIWRFADLPGENYYSKSFKANRILSSDTGLNLKNIITPEGVVMKTNSIILDEDYFSLKYNIERVSENSMPLIYFGVSILYLYEPRNKEEGKDFTFLSFKEVVASESKDEPNYITFGFKEADKEEISKFRKGIVYVAFVSGDDGVRKFEWTSTDAVEINVEF